MAPVEVQLGPSVAGRIGARQADDLERIDGMKPTAMSREEFFHMFLREARRRGIRQEILPGGAADRDLAVSLLHRLRRVVERDGEIDRQIGFQPGSTDGNLDPCNLLQEGAGLTKPSSADTGELTNASPRLHQSPPE